MKNVVIVTLLLLLGFMTWVAWRNATPVCNELVAVKNAYNQKTDLVCELSLGDRPEDSVKVRIVK